MNNFVKLDVAIELLADKISKTTQQCNITRNQEYEEELNNLMAEREEVYSGNMETIDKVINIYGNELKKNFYNE